MIPKRKDYTSKVWKAMRDCPLAMYAAHAKLKLHEPVNIPPGFGTGNDQIVVNFKDIHYQLLHRFRHEHVDARNAIDSLRECGLLIGTWELN